MDLTGIDVKIDSLQYFFFTRIDVQVSYFQFFHNNHHKDYNT